LDLRRDHTVIEWLDRGAVGNRVVGNGLLVTERTDHMGLLIMGLLVMEQKDQGLLVESGWIKGSC
jgi:hypothetical protein